MIDFHSHIIYGVDDGSISIENSLEILKKAQNVGFNKIILTPHYMKDYYEFAKEDIKERLEQLNKICMQNNIDIQLYQANEIYICNDILELINNESACSINNSKYVLFELPMNQEPLNLLEVIYSLKQNGYIPVIAHPERYIYIQKDPNKLIELIENGVLFQTNYGSIIGQYGKEVKITAELLIKNNFIHFLGTDVHRSGQIYEDMPIVIKELNKLINNEKIQNLTHNNIEIVLKNEELEIQQPIKIKQGIFSKIFK